MQQSTTKKKQKFQVQIRREGLGRLLGLKRIRSKLVQSDKDAMIIICDGLYILKRMSGAEQIIEVLRSMRSAFQKYSFHDHKTLIKQILINIKWIIGDPLHCDLIKQAAFQLLVDMYANYIPVVGFKQIPCNVFQGFNLKLIRSGLYCLAHSFLNIQKLSKDDLSSLLKQQMVGTKLLQVMANFSHNKQCFQFIKKPFLYCSFALCYLQYRWGINRNERDYLQLVEFSVNYIQKDIVEQAQRDEQLKVYFQSFEFNQQNYCEKMIQVYYPFNLLQLQTQMLATVNYDVVTALKQCLLHQLRQDNLQKPLLNCLIKILYQTENFFEDALKEQIFSYIFSQTHVTKSQKPFLKEVIILAINHITNCQTPDLVLFKAMTDSFDKTYPKTKKLLFLLKNLEQNQDAKTQKYLFQLIQHYIVVNGEMSHLDQCMKQLIQYKQGRKMICNLGCEINQQQMDTQYDYQSCDIQDQIDQQVEI